jgi:hypothetical protein
MIMPNMASSGIPISPPAQISAIAIITHPPGGELPEYAG